MTHTCTQLQRARAAQGKACADPQSDPTAIAMSFWRELPRHSAQCELDPLRSFSRTRTLFTRTAPLSGHTRLSNATISAASFRPCIDIHEVHPSPFSIFLLKPMPRSLDCVSHALTSATYAKHTGRLQNQHIVHAGPSEADRWVHPERPHHTQACCAQHTLRVGSRASNTTNGHDVYKLQGGDGEGGAHRELRHRPALQLFCKTVSTQRPARRPRRHAGL